MNDAELVEERARALYDDVRLKRVARHREAVETHAAKLFHSDRVDLPPVVDRAMDLIAGSSESTTQQIEPLTYALTRELALEFFRAHPEATARECYAAVSQHGQPHCALNSFAASLVPSVRRQLGIRRPQGGRRPRSAAQIPLPPAKPKAEPLADEVVMHVGSGELAPPRPARSGM